MIGEVPAVAMRGISKEFPWPGGRCGWVEFYNRDKDSDFNIYAKSLIDAKMLEVCSTTLPQQVLPEIMSDKRYYPMLKERTDRYQKRADEAEAIFKSIPELIVYKPNGAFYMTIVFKEGVLKEGQNLSVVKPEIANTIAPLIEKDIPLDKRFCYYLLASTGLCVVPLTSGFNSSFHGLRFTLLEPDDTTFTKIIQILARTIRAYINS